MSFFSTAVDAVVLFLFSFTGHWGLAIMLLALSLKVILIPLHLFLFRQKKLSQKIQPQLKELTEKLKEQPVELWRQMGELKKAHGVKGFAGFMAALVQLPVFMSIYTVFSGSEVMKASGVFWMSSWGLPDPLYILPLVLAGITYWQFKGETSLIEQPSYQVMKYLMPGLSFIFMMSLPSSLVFFYSVSGILNLAGERIFRAIS